MKLLKLFLAGLLVASSAYAQVEVSNTLPIPSGRYLGARNQSNTGDVGVLGIDPTTGNTTIRAQTGKAVSVTGVITQSAQDGITAAGTTIADATLLTSSISNVTTVAAGTGVKLWDAPVGSVLYVKNIGANALNLFPVAAGDAITGIAAGNSAGIAVGAMATCVRLVAGTSGKWACSEAAAA